MTLVGLTLQDVLLVARPTTPEKPFSEAIVTAEVPVVPVFMVTLDGLALTVKS